MSLSTKAMLVSLSVSMWTARRVDEKATATVVKQHKVDRIMGQYNKALINTEADSFRAVQRIGTEAREWHYAHTLAWVHKGAQLLPAAEYLEYSNQMRVFRERFDDAVATFLTEFPALKAEAKKKLNGLFDESQYPSLRELERKYGFDYTFLPVPDAGHFVVETVAADERARIQADIGARVQDATQAALKDLWTRLHEPVANMAAALSDPERRFHDTLVENIKEIVDVAPRLNLTEDPELAEMVDEVKKSLGKYSPQRLRDDEEVRRATAKRAREIAEKMSAFVT